MLLLVSCSFQLMQQNGSCSPAFLASAGDDRATPIKDLGTRRGGIDWPCFLGPKGTSESPEKGILQNWSQEGLRLVWQLPLGTGYAMPVVSKGRLYQFDRAGRNAR